MAYYQPPMAFQPPPQDPCLQWFESVDQDRTGFVDGNELHTCLQRAGHNFSPEVAWKMIRMFDMDHSGKIQLPDFQQLFAFLNAIITAFRSLDRDHTGSLNGPEVRIALQQGGFQLTEPTFQLMMRKFDNPQRGALNLSQYTELSIALGTLRNVFAFYDRQRSGQVTFTFDSFTTAGLSLI